MEKFAYTTCLEMINQRGYTILEKDEYRITAIKPDTNRVCIFFTGPTKFNVKRVQEYETLMNSLDVKHAIIVCKEDITSFATKTIQSSPVSIEIFSDKDLQYNITKHRFQPNFYRLSSEEYEKFRSENNYKLNCLPVMLKADPISKFYGYEKGDIIRITRKSGYVTYRVVK